MHLPITFPLKGQIASYTPPRIEPIFQRAYASAWTGRSFVHTRGGRWTGSVAIRQFATRLEGDKPSYDSLTPEEQTVFGSRANYDSYNAQIASLLGADYQGIFGPDNLNALEGSEHTFNLSLPLKSIALGTYSFSASDLTLADKVLIWRASSGIASLENQGIEPGAFLRMGRRVYQVYHIDGRQAYLTPGIMPSPVSAPASLLLEADGLAILRARITSASFGRTELVYIQGGYTFNWVEALDG